MGNRCRYEDDCRTGDQTACSHILAISAEKDYVVIELKVSKGYDRVVGQEELTRPFTGVSRHHFFPSWAI
jgi:hypothetical protein